MLEEQEINLGGAKLSWTDERVELLKKLWTEGLSASQIAGRLGAGVTRNAVIGKVHRLNLSGRVQQQRAAQPRAPRKQREPSLAPRAGGSNGGGSGGMGGGMPSLPTAGSTALKPVMRAEVQMRPAAVAEPQPLRLVELPKDGRVTILHLSDKTCKWPIGDPGSEEFCFCGHGPRDGSPYCEYHARLAYQPIQDRRNRKIAFG